MSNLIYPPAAAPSHSELTDIISQIANRADEAETDGVAQDIALMHRTGILHSCFPLQIGDVDFGMAAAGAKRLFDVLRWLGRANLSVGRLFEGHVNALKLVGLYGHPDVQERVAKEVEDGALMGVWGANGNRPVRFRQTHDEIILNGQKIFASGLGLVRFAIVSMSDDGAEDQPSRLALVNVSDMGRQDAASWQASGMRATWSGTFDFTNLILPNIQLVGEGGDYEREPHFDGGVWRYCALHFGGAEALLHHWRKRLGADGRLEDPLQLTRFSRAMALCQAMGSLLQDTAVQVETTMPDDTVGVDKAVASALLAKQFTEESCTEILALAEKSLGTWAFMPNAVDRIRRDLSLFVRQAAPDAKLMKAGRLILSQPADLPW